MSLTGRFSALFLAALGLVLVGFSTTLYLAARIYLERQVRDRLDAALAVLAAAAEIHADGVEWEPQERVLPLGQETGADRLRWMVFDEKGHRVDHSRNLAEADLTAAWTPHPGRAELPAHLRDRRGRTWRVSQRRLGPGAAELSGSRAAVRHEPAVDPQPPEALHPALVLTVCAPIGPMEATLATLGWFLLVLSGVIGLIAALLCRWLSRRALIPLTKLVDSARGLDAGDAGWSLDQPGTGDELDELGRAFNELLARLHVAYRQQRRFSSDASHQLRTPLTVLIGQIQVALRHERSGEDYRRVLKSALGRAVQLAQIVEALMFLARAGADASLPDGEPLEMTRWVSEYLAARSKPDRPAEIAHHADGPDPLWVRAHPALLGQLLENLLDNAAKYGRPGGSIVVETRRDGATALLAVEDCGPGIPAEEIPHLFEPFYRSAQARRAGLPGVGLGLAVVHRIATASGGAVAVRSQRGRGARFEVRLPIATPVDAEVTAMQNQGDRVAPEAQPARPVRPAPTYFD
jgi:signal transduction histidine kinase